jgi:hypothetical protein
MKISKNPRSFHYSISFYIAHHRLNDALASGLKMGRILQGMLKNQRKRMVVRHIEKAQR